MDKETEKWYEDQFELFNTAGWKAFVEKVEEMFEVYNDVTSVEDEKHLYQRQGILDILRWISNWEDTCARTFKELTDE